MIRPLALVALLAAAAHAEPPCDDVYVDPVTTPVRTAAIDAQRGACLRDQIELHLDAHALIDTPGFHGVLGGDLRIGSRMRILRRFELGAVARLIDGTFVQNAVNKATALSFGPLVLTGGWSGPLGTGAVAALLGSLEVPATRDTWATTHLSGELTAAVTAQLRDRVYLHARLGMLWMYAASTGGDTSRHAFRAGADLARRFHRRMSLQAGAELQAGWYGAIDHVNVRAGIVFRIRGGWRGAAAVGIPVGGDEKTNGILDLGITRALE